MKKISRVPVLLVRVAATLTLLFLTVCTCFGQNDPGLPCIDPDDPDPNVSGGCVVPIDVPLDTWVVVLAAGALIVTVIHLYRKQIDAQRATLSQ